MEDIRDFKGIYYSLNDTTGIFCCCQVPKTERKKPENYLEFTLENDVIRALWLSPETGRFLGLNEQERQQAVEDGMSIHEFFRHCPLSGEDVLELMDAGRKVYTIGFGDGRMETKAAQLSSVTGDREPVYSLQYNLLDSEAVSEDDQNTESGMFPDKRIAIRTFGYFDVFVNGNPIAFKSAKAKELLAILVDRRGGYVSAGDAISYLWEDEPANKVTLARYRKVAMRLKNELQDNNINDLVISLDGKRCINQKIVKCDLYEYLTDKQKNREMFRGSYMLNYSWSEYTQAELQKN